MHQRATSHPARPSLYARLAGVQSDLDRMLSAVANGLPDQRAYDQAEAEAQAIAARLVAAFRGQRGT